MKDSFAEDISVSDKGEYCELMITSDLIRKGYYVYKSLNRNSPFDAFIYRNEEQYKVEIKMGRMHKSTGSLQYSRPKYECYDILAVYCVTNDTIHYFKGDKKVSL